MKNHMLGLRLRGWRQNWKWCPAWKWKTCYEVNVEIENDIRLENEKPHSRTPVMRLTSELKMTSGFENDKPHARTPDFPYIPQTINFQIVNCESPQFCFSLPGWKQKHFRGPVPCSLFSAFDKHTFLSHTEILTSKHVLQRTLKTPSIINHRFHFVFSFFSEKCPHFRVENESETKFSSKIFLLS